MNDTSPAIDHPEPLLRRILAPNPSPMTHHGTNSYILGKGAVAIIDPGPDLPAHQETLLSALAPGETVSHILVTHSHLDHSPLAPILARRTGAPVLAFGDSRSGRSATMQRLAKAGLARGGEGVDTGFRPDARLADGDRVDGAGWSLRALHTPGHFGNHLCFAWEDRVFSGDHVMGWSSSLVSPPDGDMQAYMASLDHLAAQGAMRLYPGHGAAIDDPAARIAFLTAHRRAREAEIVAALARRPANATALARAIYTDITPELMPAAARNVFAHLIDLTERNLATSDREIAFDAPFTLR